MADQIVNEGISIGVEKLVDFIEDAANRTILVVNEDDHPIQFELCQKDDSRGKHMIEPGQWLRLDFTPNVSTCWCCNAWFMGTDQPPNTFEVWKGHGSSKRYTVRKQDGVYKAEINGDGEHMHLKFD